MVRIGIDLGGTKIEGIVLDEQGVELARQRIATPEDDYPGTLAAIKMLIEQLESSIKHDATIGICTPGALSYAYSSVGLLKNSNTVCMNGKPVQQDLEVLLQRPVKITNDANCFALSEAIDGVAKNAAIVFGVIVGTGVGAGIVVNKHVLNGANAIAGEWGHNPMPWPDADELPGLPCYCGKNGCIETFLSGPGMAKNHEINTGHVLTSRQIVEQAEQGDVDCEQALQYYERRMAKGLAHVINILDPDVIVLGGGMGNIQRLYSNVPKLWGEYVFSDTVSTKLLPPEYGDSSGVRGAAWLWNDEA
ncbi:MAG: ROK family protein [Gammaproteobacteria bacterium]|nr:ROK family protein [Gammaproteobacteria bacterium]MCK5262292.1 ROK family protein [Gammaproteobacteria bacterium]